MGVILIIGLLAGIVCGLVVTAILGTGAVVVARKQSARRRHVWPALGAAAVVLTPLLMLAVYRYPWPAVRPGSDYNIAMQNLFLGGIGYGASPGMAALLACLILPFLPGKVPPVPPPLAPTPPPARKPPSIQA